MADKVIKHDQVIEDGVFDPTIQSGKELLKIVNDLIAGFKDFISTTSKKIPIGDPKNLKELREQSLAINQVGAAYKGLEVSQKRQAQLQAQLEKSTDQNVKGNIRYTKTLADQRNELKQNLIIEQAKKGSIDELRARLALVTKQWAALSEQEREETIAGKNIVAQKLALTQQLKKLEAATGDHRREVGNYTGAIGKLGKGLAGISGLLATIGNALGINTEGLRAAAETSRELIKVTRELRHAEELTEVAHAANTNALNAETAATEELAAAQSATVGIFGAIALAVVAVGAVLYRYKDQIFGVTNAQKEKRKADDGVLITDDKLRESYNESLKVIRDLKLEYKLLTGQITELDAELEKIGNQNSDTLDQIKKDSKEKLSEITGFWSAAKIIIAQGLGIGTLEIQKQADEIRSVNKDAAAATAAANKKRNEEEKVAKAKQREKDLEAIKQTNESILKLQTEFVTDEFERQRLQENLEYEEKKKDAKKNILTQGLYYLELQKLAQEHQLKIRLINKEEAAKQAEEDKKARDKAFEEAVKQYDELQKIIGEGTTATDKENNDFNNRLKAAGLFNRDRETLTAAELQALENLERIHNQNLQKIDEDAAEKRLKFLKDVADKEFEQTQELEGEYYSKQKDALLDLYLTKKITKENFEKESRKLELQELETQRQTLIDYGKSTFDIDAKIRAIKLKNKEDDDKEDLDKKKQQQEKILKQAEQFEKELFELSKDRIDKERKLNEQKISDLDKQIETQTQLAIAGEKNTLGFLQKERAKALEEKAALEKREAKRKEAQQLAELFLEFYKNFASEKGGSFAAAAKATAATLIAKGIAESFAGAFAEGVENLNGAGTETSDSNIALLSKGESVITARATKETKGLATALNDKGIIGAKEWMLQNISIPQVHPKEEVNDAMMQMLYSELTGLRKDIKNKKELTVSRNILGELVIDEKQNGNHLQTIQKESPINRNNLKRYKH